jgi:hypothetical protein
MQWKVAGIGFESQAIDVGGLNPWDHQWHSMEREAVELPHPAHPSQRHRFDVYEMEAAGQKVTFAAGELSNGVWGFYVPK